MEVSIALATYKGGKHLRQQLDSIAAQTELPAELVVSDDNSPDDTLAVLRDFAANAPFQVRILPPHERLGFSDNFLHAAEHCRSPLMMFCDQDDVWLPQKLAISRRRLLHDNSAIVLHTLTLTDMEMRPFGHLSQGIERTDTYEPLELEPYLCGYGNSMMFRSELLRLVPRALRPPCDGRVLSHDTWVYILAAALGRVSHMAESYVLYRQGGNISQLDNRSRWRRLKDVATFDASGHSARAAFNGAMAAIFDGIGEKAAAERYRQRLRTALLRLDLFAAPSLRERLRCFREIAESRPLPAAKNLVLGVMGLGFRKA